MIGKFRLIAVVSFVFLFSGCAYHSTSKNWNGLMGADGKPTYYKETSKIAVNLFVGIPLFGNVSIDGMMEDLTGAIAEENGDHVRIVQGGNENYWYGFPPFTWILTPVITTVSAEYTPHTESYEKDQEEIRNTRENGSGLNPTKW